MQKSERPNIVFILTDQLRADILSAYGGRACETPNLDRLAADSVIYDNAYTSCAVCTPARASLQTGRYPSKTGMMTNNLVQHLQDGPELLSRKLQAQGYSIGYTGKWHLGDGPSLVGYEADDFPGHGLGGHIFEQYKQYLADNGLTHATRNKLTGHYDEHYAAEEISPIEATVDYFLVERAIHYIDRFKARERPFYFQLNFWGPHEPYLAPTKHLDRYRDAVIDPWPNFYDNGDKKPSIHQVKRANDADWSTFEPLVKHYLAFTSAIDEQIGRLLDYLKRSGLYDDTVILFSSDHGESLGIHGGLCDKAFFMYEETCKVPLFVKPAQAQAGSAREAGFVGSCDIYATILDLAGAESRGEQVDGRSFARAAVGLLDWPDCVVTEGSGLENVLFTQRMIRKGDYKYVFNCGDSDELYDLRLDPHELNNLAGEPAAAETLREMRLSLAAWMSEHQDKLLHQYKLLRLR